MDYSNSALVFLAIVIGTNRFSTRSDFIIIGDNEKSSRCSAALFSGHRLNGSVLTLRSSSRIKTLVQVAYVETRAYICAVEANKQ